MIMVAMIMSANDRGDCIVSVPVKGINPIEGQSIPQRFFIQVCNNKQASRQSVILLISTLSNSDNLLLRISVCYFHRGFNTASKP